jgi:hypothetical protein
MRNDDPFAELIRSLEENLERESRANPPPPRPPQPVAQNQGGGRGWLWIILPLLVFILFGRLISFYADLLWYDSLELRAVFLTRIWAQFGLFLAGALVAFLLIAANVLLARRLEPFGLTNTALEQFAVAAGIRPLSIILTGAAVLALLMGINLSANWEEVLLYLNQIPFGLADPVFQRDVSFFLFSLPVWSDIRTWLLVVLFVALVASGLVAGLGTRGWTATRPVLLHLALLAAMLLLLFAWGYRISAFNLVYGTRGAVFGAGYTDVNAQLPAYNLLSIVTLAAAVILVATVFVRQGWRAILGVIGVWAVMAVVAGNFYPAFVQRFQVSPNELNLEREFISSNIAFTRAAFDLEDVEQRPATQNAPLTAQALRTAPETVRNIRLWDYRPLLQTYNQVQALTQYYEFNDVDIDRYVINGELRQVMLSARELVPERLAESAQTWVNRKLVYTHGYGVAASPVAQVARDGLPTFLLKDLPPQGELTLTQPQIYFGERTNDYVIANTRQPEFSFSNDEATVTTNFTATTGIDMSMANRLLFAVHFADLNMLLNSDITGESQLLWRRNIVERIRDVAPFLQYDRDPYIVIGQDGRLYWFLDAYVVSDRFPYSTPVANGLNYIRNPVKIVTNAYDGTMHFYVVDEGEPIVAAYRQIFPTLFSSLSEMPADLQQHIRYPSDLFTVQAEVYRTYHMTNPDEFYNKEDLWAWPEEIFDNEQVRMEPYYVLLKLPGDEDLQFMQILPFTPANRENMIAWLAIYNDPEKYGQQIVYEFGKDTLFYGPKQIEARIDQDPVISQQLTLWNQQGSSVIRGNLLVIPLGDSLLYVEPLYLQAASGRIPELARVILATGDRIVMAENLGLALAELLGRNVLVEAGLADLAAVDGELPPSTADGGDDVLSTEQATIEGLIQQANTQFTAAQAQQRSGDWAGYGTQLAALERTLTQLAQLAGVNTPVAPITTTQTITP